MNSYPAGNTIRLEDTITDAGTGAPVTPASVQLIVRDPSGDVTNHTPTSEGAGVYSFEIVASESGIWGYRFVGAGTDSVADEKQFYVRPVVV